MTQPTCQQLVRDDDGTTVPCDRPLPDTARVCPRCVNRMRATLARCHDLWPHVAGLIGRDLHLGGVPGTGTRRNQPTAGPYCPSCDHASCYPLMTQAHRARNEAPLAHEEPLLINPDALEDAWAVENTLTTWARVVAEELGVDVPNDRTRTTLEPAMAAPLVADARCEFSDLPTAPALQCACGHPMRSHP